MFYHSCYFYVKYMRGRGADRAARTVGSGRGSVRGDGVAETGGEGWSRRVREEFLDSLSNVLAGILRNLP